MLRGRYKSRTGFKVKFLFKMGHIIKDSCHFSFSLCSQAKSILVYPSLCDPHWQFEFILSDCCTCLILRDVKILMRPFSFQGEMKNCTAFKLSLVINVYEMNIDTPFKWGLWLVRFVLLQSSPPLIFINRKYIWASCLTASIVANEMYKFRHLSMFLRYTICVFGYFFLPCFLKEADFVLLRYAVLSIYFNTHTVKADSHKYILCFRYIIAFIPLFGEYRSEHTSG